MKRTIIKIDEELCNGCGNCVSGCHEGALQLINNKAVIISELYCDGLGACIGDCPMGAITLEERTAEPYDEIAVMNKLFPKGKDIILAHLKHLKEHNENESLNQAVEYLKNKNLHIDISSIQPEIILSNQEDISDFFINKNSTQNKSFSCPGVAAREIKPSASSIPSAKNIPHTDFVELKDTNFQTPYEQKQTSELRHFPVQLHLINPQSTFLKEADLLLASDCSAFAARDFHSRFLKGKSLAIACPKLDSNLQQYTDKITEMIDLAKINTITIIIMEVPCCQGLVRIVNLAQGQASRKIPVELIELSVNGEVIANNWL